MDAAGAGAGGGIGGRDGGRSAMPAPRQPAPLLEEVEWGNVEWR